MTDCTRRVVIDMDFETALGQTSRAIREQGLQLLARVDVRDHFWRGLGHAFRRYFLLDAWSPELALAALRANLDAAVTFRTTFAVYELADGETAVTACERFAPDEWRREAPELARLADRERERVARVLDQVSRATIRQVPASPTA